MEERICQLQSCGKKFIPHCSNVKLGNGRFCSKQCWGKYRHLQSLELKVCKICGAPFKGRKKRIVCSRTCGTEWMVRFRKKRDTYAGKIIVGNLKSEESEIIRNIRLMPEIIPKIIEMLNARKTMKKVYGRFINERVVKD